MNEGNLLTPKEIAAFLGVPLTWVYDRTRQAADDPIPHHKLGKYVRFDPQEVRDWIAEHRAHRMN